MKKAESISRLGLCQRMRQTGILGENKNKIFNRKGRKGFRKERKETLEPSQEPRLIPRTAPKYSLPA
jgi:hypothetical protein